MKDKYDREIDYLRISVTDRCNLRCLYCMPDGIKQIEKEKIISDEDIIKVVEESVKVGIKKVRITGGEPLVRKGIYELISKINSVEGINEIVLTTNGLNLIGNVEKIKKAGISRVNLSLDTLNRNKLKNISNTSLEFDYKTLILELHKYNVVPIKINCVLLKGINDDEIMDFYNFSLDHNVEVRFIELMPFESESFQYKDYYVSKDELLTKYTDLQLHSKSKNVEYYKTPDNVKTIGFINAVSSKFCEDCNRLRLTSDGYIKPCLHSSSEIYVKGKSKEEVITKLKEAIKTKPKQHSLDKNYSNQAKRSMNKIGG